MIDYLVREIAIAISIINLAMGFTSRAVGIALLLLALYLFSIKILYDNRNKLRSYKKCIIILSVISSISIIVVLGYYIYHIVITDNTSGIVRILNKNAEQKKEFGLLTRAFKKKYRIHVSVESPNAKEYTEILSRRYSGEGDYPTLFMLSGPNDLNKYEAECLDLTNTAVAKELVDNDFALKGKDGHIYGVGFIIESYGLTVNTTLLENAGYGISEIHSFSDLKRIVQDITARKNELGFVAFTTGTVGSDSGYYRLAQHAPAVPLYYELQDSGFDFKKHLEGTYMDAFQNYVDLCLDNATTSRKEANDHSLEEARREFIEGKAVFHQDGSWSYKMLKTGLDKNGAGEIAVIPMYMGINGEETQALNETCSYYWCVDRYASKDDIKASLKFLKWLVTSEEAIQFVVNQMGVQMPYRKAEMPDNVYLKTLQAQIENGYTPIRQYYNYGDRTSWVNGLTYTIEAYASGTGEWSSVKKAFTKLW